MMAKVYVSSTTVDLEAERQVVIDWLVAAQHQVVHSYRPNSHTVRDGCLADVDTCDLYVLILGHRYGFQPPKDNPEHLSITQLEFRRAGHKGKPRIALLRTNIPNISLSDVADPPRLALVQAFRDEVTDAVRAAEFADPRGLVQGLSTGVQAELAELEKAQWQSGYKQRRESDFNKKRAAVLQALVASLQDIQLSSRRELMQSNELDLQVKGLNEFLIKNRLWIEPNDAQQARQYLNALIAINAAMARGTSEDLEIFVATGVGLYSDSVAHEFRNLAEAEQALIETVQNVLESL
jgi:hypothetical protein